MFWGLIVKQGKKYSKVVEQDFQLTHAALDLTDSTGDVQVMLTTDNITYLLCTLNKGIPQVRLDQQFAAGDEISFATKGQGVVHLTGNVLPDEFGDMGDDEEDEDEEQEEMVEKNGAGKVRSAKQAAKVKVAKEIASGEVPSESDDDDATFTESMLDESVANGDGDDDDEDDDDDDGEDDEDDDEDDDEEDDEEADDDDDEEDDEEEEEELPKAKQAKLASNDSKGSVNGNGKAKEQKEAAPKKQEQQKTVRTLQDGLMVEDLKVGSGPEAKPGKKVVVYYEGRLKSNNKVFDSTNKGPGLKFNLGRGEVIKGWDLGVAGMKVGGKRRLVIPHKLAYGSKGSPPVIPPCSTLVFEVELRKVL